MPHANRNGHRLYYEQEGAGDPPFVFVHGWCCSHTYFQPQFDHFKESHSVTALDLRGFGHSDAVDGDYDPPMFADDVAWLCGQLGLTRPIVVGHSLGGAIAIEVGARHPTLPGAVVAVDPAPIDPSSDLRAQLSGFAEAIRGSDGGAIRRSFIETYLFIELDDADRRKAIADEMCAADTGVAAAAMRGIAEWDGATALAACAVPTLVLLAQVLVNEPARLRALNEKVHIGVTVGAGHFHQLEVPEQVTPMIERFVQLAEAQGRGVEARPASSGGS